jgi:hypothetical protein
MREEVIFGLSQAGVPTAPKKTSKVEGEEVGNEAAALKHTTPFTPSLLLEIASLAAAR